MRTILKISALLLIVNLYPVHSFAQKRIVIESEEPDSIILVRKDKAGNEIIRIIDENQQNRFQDPKAPRFLLTDSKGRFALGIGGYVRATAEYDFGGIVENVDFFPALIPNPGNGDYSRNQFQMDVTTSTLFLKLVGRTKRLGDFVVYTAGNFRGDGKTFYLQNAYASFLGFTAGYDYGSFMDAVAGPSTIDFAGPGGQTIYRTTQIRYTHTFLKNWRFGVGVELPDVDGTTNEYVSINTQRMPNFPAYIQYRWKPGNHVRIAGIIRSMTYNSNVYKKAYVETGWGVMASTVFNPAEKWQFLGQITYGHGIGQFMNDLSNLNVDLVPNPKDPGKMQALPMLGWYAGLRYNITPQLFISSTYSQSRLYSENGYPNENPEMFRRGQYLAANAFWNITANLQVGAEYLRGWKGDFNYDTHHANRINAVVQYSF